MLALFLSSLLFSIALSTGTACDDATPCTAPNEVCARRDAAITAPDPSNFAQTITKNDNQQQCEEIGLCEILGISGECKSVEVTTTFPFVYNTDQCPTTADISTVPAFDVGVVLNSNLVCDGGVDACTVDINLARALKALTSCYIPTDIAKQVQCDTTNDGTDCPADIKDYFTYRFPACACNVLYPLLQSEAGYQYIPVVANWIKDYVVSPLKQFKAYYENCVADDLVCDGQVAVCTVPDDRASPRTDLCEVLLEFIPYDTIVELFPHCAVVRRRLEDGTGVLAGDDQECDEDGDTPEGGYISAYVKINVCAIDRDITRDKLFQILKKGITLTFNIDEAEITFVEEMEKIKRYKNKKNKENREAIKAGTQEKCQLAFSIEAALEVYWPDVDALGKFFYTFVDPVVDAVGNAAEDGFDFQAQFGEYCLQASVDETDIDVEGFGAVEVAEFSLGVYRESGTEYLKEDATAQSGVRSYSFMGVVGFLVVVMVKVF